MYYAPRNNMRLATCPELVRWVGGCALLLAACATSERDSFTTDDQPVDPGTGGETFAPNDGDRSMPPDVTPIVGKTVFYAHTNTTLFKVDAEDPKAKPESLGAFDCIGTASGENADGSMTDLAIDETGRLFGVSQHAVFLDMKVVPGGGVECKQNRVELARTGQFLGASFAPKGLLDPQKEVLIVADTTGDLYAVDTATGALTKVGAFGNVPKNDGQGHNYPTKNVGKAWELSGDIVFLANQGNPLGFATVRDCPSPPSTQGCNETDTLIELDLSKLSLTSPGVVTRAVRGMVSKGTYCNDSDHSGYGSIYGLAAYQGILLGFSRQRPERGSNTQSSALIVRIENKNGAACLVSDATSQAAGGWAGAGVTTLAPVLDPGPQ